MTVPLYCQSPRDPLNHPLVSKLKADDRLRWVGKPPSEAFLIVHEGRLGLAGAQFPKVHPVFADFLSGAANHRRAQGGGVGQPVAKAIGLNKKRDLRVWDATAGLGRDSFVLASLGAHVTMFERNPYVTLLLEDGLERLRLSADNEVIDIANRLSFYPHAVTEHSETAKTKADVIYLDPMFPERGKSAKVKKDMAMFHELVGVDDDADALLEPAFEFATYRVVVKRSKSAPHLANKEPSTAIIGKSSRFDIYTKKAIS